MPPGFSRLTLLMNAHPKDSNMLPTLKIIYGSLAAAAVCVAAPGLAGAAPIPEDCKIGAFALGCQAYTFNRFSVFEAIEKTAQAGAKVIEFYPGQKLSPEQPGVKWDHNAPDEVIEQVKAQLAKHGLRPVNYGVVGAKDDAEWRKIFEFAKKLGLYAVTTEAVQQLDSIEKLVKEFDIRVAIHNHPRRPNDPNYKVWDPAYVLSVVKDRDPRIGACADTGHWLRSGLTPLECYQILSGRIISTHFKDLNEKGPQAHDVPYGTGVSDIPALLDELKRQGFQGNLSIEYEYHWEQSLPEVAQCIGFVRGYQARR
jgi:sugar phosphate isomerase/epimerase